MTIYILLNHILYAEWGMLSKMSSTQITIIEIFVIFEYIMALIIMIVSTRWTSNKTKALQDLFLLDFKTIAHFRSPFAAYKNDVALDVFARNNFLIMKKELRSYVLDYIQDQIINLRLVIPAENRTFWAKTSSNAPSMSSYRLLVGFEYRFVGRYNNKRDRHVSNNKKKTDT